MSYLGVNLKCAVTGDPACQLWGSRPIAGWIGWWKAWLPQSNSISKELYGYITTARRRFAVPTVIYSSVERGQRFILLLARQTAGISSAHRRFGPRSVGRREEEIYKSCTGWTHLDVGRCRGPYGLRQLSGRNYLEYLRN